MCTTIPLAANIPVESGSPEIESPLADRLVGAATGALELFGVYLGSRLGLYSWLDRAGSSTEAAVAAGAGIDERYAREWLEQQAVAGFLATDANPDPVGRRYWVDESNRGALVEETDGEHVAPLARMVVGIAGVLDQVATAYRTGDGVPYENYGADFRHGQGSINRPAFEADLVESWLPAIPDVSETLAAGGSIADVGCGQGYSTVAMAKAWPNAEVLGVDVDRASVTDARSFADGQGVPARFAELGGEGLAGLGSFDVITMLECLHDMAHPGQALRSAREALNAGGVLVLADELVADRFAAPGDEMERMMYGWSISHCLPASRTEAGSAALGTVLRRSTVEQLAVDAGFSSVEVVDVDGGFFRIYALRP